MEPQKLHNLHFVAHSCSCVVFLPKQWKHYTKHTEVLLLLLLDMLLVRSASPPALCQHPAPRTCFRTFPLGSQRQAQGTGAEQPRGQCHGPQPAEAHPRDRSCSHLFCCRKTFMRNFNQNTSFYSFVRTQPRDVKCRGETGKGLPGGLEGSVLESCHRPCAQHLTLLGFGVFLSQ